jgi:glycosyltransferase involved in cell wall biosynthesis
VFAGDQRALDLNEQRKAGESRARGYLLQGLDKGADAQPHPRRASTAVGRIHRERFSTRYRYMIGNQRPAKRDLRRALFLTKYGVRGASTRHRVLQYIPFLDAAGIECHVSPMLSDRYLLQKLEAGYIDVREVMASLWTRLATLRRVREFDVVIVHMEALSYFPAFYERILSTFGVRYIYDFDDASFHQYDLSSSRVIRTMLASKVATIIKHAALVIAGNEYLAEYARRHNPRVVVVPTVVDTTRFAPRDERADGRRIVIGWIGSPSTSTYVKQLADVWPAVTTPGDCVLRLVGSGDVQLPGTRAEVKAWSEAGEIDDLNNFDIGIMPLTDDPWSRGKCGLKLIEYMACGAPVVASPVGVNARIVSHGQNGFLCTTHAEWISTLRRLVTDAGLRRRLGAQGRIDVVAKWSLERWAPEMVRLVRSVADGLSVEGDRSADHDDERSRSAAR